MRERGGYCTVWLPLSPVSAFHGISGGYKLQSGCRLSPVFQGFYSFLPILLFSLQFGSALINNQLQLSVYFLEVFRVFSPFVTSIQLPM